MNSNVCPELETHTLFALFQNKLHWQFLRRMQPRETRRTFSLISFQYYLDIRGLWHGGIISNLVAIQTIPLSTIISSLHQSLLGNS